MRVEAHGKEVLLDGEHLADAVSEEAAEAIANALEYSGFTQQQMPLFAYTRIIRILR